MYNYCVVKNISNKQLTIHGIILEMEQTYRIQDSERVGWMESDEVLSWLTNGQIAIGNDIEFFTSISDSIDWLKNKNRQTVEVAKQTPYAEPLYKTKNNAVPEVAVVAPNSQANIDLFLTEERYISGGEIIIYDALPGDWIQAQVVDINKILPLQIKENDLVVSEYISRRWIAANKTFDIPTVAKIDTRPLNARIIAGLALRVVYHADGGGESPRKVFVNYDMSKKL